VSKLLTLPSAIPTKSNQYSGRGEKMGRKNFARIVPGVSQRGKSFGEKKYLESRMMV